MIWWMLFFGLGLAYCFYRVDGHINALQSRIAYLDAVAAELQRELRRTADDADELRQGLRKLTRHVDELTHPPAVVGIGTPEVN